MKDKSILYKWLRIILLMIAFHSFAVGLGLIFMPGSWLKFFDFSETSKSFFQYQGGVFHLVMCTCYAMAAFSPRKYYGLVILTIAAKSIAFVFLTSYYFFIEANWMVLFSGITDAMMGSITWVIYNSHQKASFN